MKAGILLRGIVFKSVIVKLPYNTNQQTLPQVPYIRPAINRQPALALLSPPPPAAMKGARVVLLADFLYECVLFCRDNHPAVSPLSVLPI